MSDINEYWVEYMNVEANTGMPRKNINIKNIWRGWGLGVGVGGLKASFLGGSIKSSWAWLKNLLPKGWHLKILTANSYLRKD